MPIAQFNATKVARFRLSHTMVASVGGNDTGFRVGNFGSMTPGLLGGIQINAVRHNTVSGGLILETAQPGGAGSILQDFWKSLRFRSTDPDWDGIDALSADATFSNAVNAVWQFDGAPYDEIFNNGVTYLLEWRL